MHESAKLLSVNQCKTLIRRQNQAAIHYCKTIAENSINWTVQPPGESQFQSHHSDDGAMVPTTSSDTACCCCWSSSSVCMKIHTSLEGNNENSLHCLNAEFIMVWFFFSQTPNTAWLFFLKAQRSVQNLPSSIIGTRANFTLIRWSTKWFYYAWP